MDPSMLNKPDPLIARQLVTDAGGQYGFGPVTAHPSGAKND
jgi:hypothetical protein